MTTLIKIARCDALIHTTCIVNIFMMKILAEMATTNLLTFSAEMFTSFTTD